MTDPGDRPLPRPPQTPARSSSVAVRTRPTVAATITDWRRDAIVVRLTRQLQGMVVASARRSAEDVVAIGNALERIRDRLPRGTWLQWIEDNAGFGRSTADNYIELASPSSAT
jgi:hypothetical protein